MYSEPDRPIVTTPTLKVTNLAVDYGQKKRKVRVIEDVSFSIMPGETLALVGESGSGKSTIGKAILGMVQPAAGTCELNGNDITHYSPKARRGIATEIQAIFQNPYGSLNPSLKIGEILAEPLYAVKKLKRAEATEACRKLLERVGMPSDTLTRYPGNFSGGQRQRIAIARAIALEPSIIVCDEPTSALDVSTQAAVLELLNELQDRLRVAYLFITHDLAVVREFADRAAVLEQGRIVELGDSQDLCSNPQHPYTQALVAAAPVPDPIIQKARRLERLDRLGQIGQAVV